ncbi:MAG TPA: mechanosensitive ion channel [Thermotogota bacterium]|mgnify:CR=1 FL=1|nr:mechanosensitive ion channel [Thermotogota bacterium]HRW34722.1 mechanosensitive ion channel [Thermotogota bacterium]
MNVVMGFLAAYGWSIIGAIITFIVGWWLIKIVLKILVKILEKTKVEQSLVGFLRTLADFMLKMILIITTLSMVGVDMTPFFAILGGLAVAVGLALKDSLGNFAAGVMILFFKPFKVGDFIETSGASGSVMEIQIMTTVLKTADNKHIIIPNGSVVTSVITNYSKEATRRLNMTFGVGYDSDMQKVKQLINEIIETDERILKDPAPQILMSELADSSVNFSVRLWVKAGDYWNVNFDMNEKVFKVFNDNGINIPYPQLDVHVNQA